MSNQADKRRRHTEPTDSSRPSDLKNNDPRTTHAGFKDLSCSASNFTLRPTIDDLHANKTLTKNALSKGKMPTRHSELPGRISHESYHGSEQTSKRRRLDISPRAIRRFQALAPPPLSQPNRRTSRAQIPDSQIQATINVVQPPASTSTGLFSNLFSQNPPNLLSQSPQLPASNHTTPKPPNEPITGDQDKLSAHPVRPKLQNEAARCGYQRFSIGWPKTSALGPPPCCSAANGRNRERRPIAETPSV